MALAMLLNFATKPFKNTRLQFVAVILMISAMILNNILQGSLIENLNVPTVKEIDTLNKLLEANLDIITTPYIYNCLQHVTGDQTLQKLKAKLSIAPLPPNRVDPMFVEGKFAFLQPKEKAYSLAETIYDEQGHDLIYVVPEQVHSFYVAFAARRDLFMVWKLNQLIMLMSQHGVIQREFAQMFAAVDLLQIERARQGMFVEPVLHTVGLEEIGQLLYFAVVVYVACVLVFGLEIVFDKWLAKMGRCYTNFTEFAKVKCCFAIAKTYEFLWWFIVFIKTA